MLNVSLLLKGQGEDIFLFRCDSPLPRSLQNKYNDNFDMYHDLSNHCNSMNSLYLSEVGRKGKINTSKKIISSRQINCLLLNFPSISNKVGNLIFWSGSSECCNETITQGKGNGKQLANSRKQKTLWMKPSLKAKEKQIWKTIIATMQATHHHSHQSGVDGLLSYIEAKLTEGKFSGYNWFRFWKA